MDIKKELVWGTILTIFVVAVALFFVVNFNSSANMTNKQIQVLPPTATETTPIINKIALTVTEVAKHNSPNDCWIIINNKVYKISQYLNIHPGGPDTITPYCGTDATQAFETKGDKGSHSQKAMKQLELYFLGLFGESLQK